MAASDDGTDWSAWSERYVEGGEIQWGGVATGIAGVFVSLFASYVVGSILFVSDTISRFLAWVSSGYASLVSFPFDEGSGVIALSAVQFSDWIEVLGAFAFPVAAFATAVFVLVILWGVRRFVA